MAYDESSEGRRYSYKPKKKVESNRKPVAKAKEKAEPPKRVGRYKAKGGDVQPKKRKGTFFGSDLDVGIAKETPKQKHTTEQNKELIRKRRHDYMTDRVYADMPHRVIIPRNRPEGGPAPMIEPNVGPVGQMRSQVAHTYGFTPEAYRDLRYTSVRLAPPTDDFEKEVGGYYDEPSDRIYINPSFGPEYAKQTLAHEQGHAQWAARGYENPEVRDQYRSDLAQWRNDDFRPNGTIGNNAGRRATDDMWLDREFYPDQPGWPTEDYARTLEFSPNENHNTWPDYMRPYYSGFIRGTDRLSTGEPTPPVPGATPPEQIRPDENGVWGSYRNWR